MKRKLSLIVAALLLATFAGLAIHGVTKNRQELHRTNIQLESKTSELHELEIDYKKLNTDLKEEAEKKTQDSDRIKQLEDEKQQLEERYKALEVSKAAEKAEQQRLANATPKLSATASAATNCGDNMYKQYIYQHESGCRTDAVNSIGCRGIGQACPGDKLPCSNSDFECQDRFFTQYALDRYGSWEGAYNAWKSKGWW